MAVDEKETYIVWWPSQDTSRRMLVAFSQAAGELLLGSLTIGVKATWTSRVS